MFLTCLVRLHLCTILGCDITALKDSVFEQKISYCQANRAEATETAKLRPFSKIAIL